MTFYIILETEPGQKEKVITEPMQYLQAKDKMREMKQKEENSKKKFRLLKTSY